MNTDWSTLCQIDEQHIWHPFTYRADKPNRMLSHAQGQYLYTHSGERIFDAISSWWVNLHGHAHPALAEAIATQAHALEQVIFAGYAHKPAAELVQGLRKVLHQDFSRFFFSDNGSTAVEVALKMALQYYHNTADPRDTFVAFRSAYHGDTFGAMSVSARGLFTAPFARQLFQVQLLDDPDTTPLATLLEQLMVAIRQHKVAALILEPLVMGAGGMRMYDAEVLSMLVEVARAHGILVIFDEVFTGFGRTGRLFAHQHIRQLPDFLCLSKGLTGGFLPMGLTATTEQIHSAFTGERSHSFLHGHSFTANPMACAVAKASLDILVSDACQQQIAHLTQWLSDAGRTLAAQPGIENVRQTGTILAMDLPAEDAGYMAKVGPRVYDWCQTRGVLIRPMGNTVYLVPPYVSTQADIVHATEALMAGLAANWQEA